MTADKPTHLVPKLRFPEFQDDPPWSAPLLADLYDFKRTNTLSRDKLNYVTGTIRNIHYGDIHTKFNPLFQVREEHVPYVNPDSSAKEIDDDAFCKEGDIVLADASEDLNDVGKAIEVVSLDGERVVAGTHTILGTRRGSVPVVGFAGQLFQSAAVRARIKKEAQGAKVYGISAKRISAVPIPIPPTVAEQQKIADCLGSLDDLIAEEDRKLEALRKHKQGLMQQLFPQSGETVPRLRFPEFQDAGEWTNGMLKDFVKSIRTGKLDANAMVEDGNYRFYTCAKNYYWINNYAFDGEALLIAGNGAYLGYVHHYTGKFNAYQRTYVLQDFKIDVPFLKFFLNRNLPARIQLEKKDGNTPYIVLATIAEMPLLIPSTAAEQQRIADCLTAIDDQLDAQARKLDMLNQHKRGLLQQLFPSLEQGP